MSGTQCQPQTKPIKIKPGASYALLHLSDIQLDMRLQLEVLIMGIVDLILDVFFQVGHLRGKSS